MIKTASGWTKKQFWIHLILVIIPFWKRKRWPTRDTKRDDSTKHLFLFSFSLPILWKFSQNCLSFFPNDLNHFHSEPVFFFAFVWSSRWWPWTEVEELYREYFGINSHPWKYFEIRSSKRSWIVNISHTNKVLEDGTSNEFACVCCRSEKIKKLFAKRTQRQLCEYFPELSRFAGIVRLVCEAHAGDTGATARQRQHISCRRGDEDRKKLLIEFCFVSFRNCLSTTFFSLMLKSRFYVILFEHEVQLNSKGNEGTQMSNSVIKS